MNADVCVLCGLPVGDADAEKASNGELVHARCADEYEDLIYFDEFQDEEPS